MSTATPFKFLGAFPFCAEEMTTAAITSLGFAAYRGTLAEVMEKFWLVETVALTAADDGGDGGGDVYFMVGDDYAEWFSPSESTSPRARVCRSETTSDSYFANDVAPLGAIGFLTLPSHGSSYVRLIFRRVVLDTDTSEYCLLFSLDVTADDAVDKRATTDQTDPDLTVDAVSDSTAFGVAYPVKCSNAAYDDIVMTAAFDTFFSF